MDLVYNDLKPTSESCPHITASMTVYANKNFMNYTQHQIKRLLLSLFAERLSGENLLFADFLAAYCDKVKINFNYLECAEKICTKFDTKESMALMQKIFYIKVNAESDFDFEKYFDKELFINYF